MAMRTDGAAPDREQAVLGLGLRLSAVFAVLPLLVSLASDSEMMLLEAKYGLVDAVMAYLTVRAYRKMRQPPDGDYHYGYAKYEPLVNVLEGTMLMVVCLSTLVTGARDLIHPDDIANDGLVIAYSCASAAVCLGMSAYLRRQARLCRSELLRADAQVWLVDGLVSLAACVAFGLMRLAAGTRWSPATPYVDPLLAMAVALGMLPSAKALLGESLRDLLDASPGGEVQARTLALVEDYRSRHGLPGPVQVRLRKAGRRVFVAARFSDDPAKPLAELAAVRSGLSRDLKELCPDLELYVHFDRS
jgi:cation diffusion facilitator family transporter